MIRNNIYAFNKDRLQIIQGNIKVSKAMIQDVVKLNMLYNIVK